jgi:hypothetical protein
MAIDKYEMQEKIVERLAEVLFNLTDEEDMKGEEEIAMDEYRAFALIMTGSLDLKVVGVDEDGLITVNMRILDLKEYVEKILSE